MDIAALPCPVHAFCGVEDTTHSTTCVGGTVYSNSEVHFFRREIFGKLDIDSIDRRLFKIDEIELFFGLKKRFVGVQKGQVRNIEFQRLDIASRRVQLAVQAVIDFCAK